MHPKMLICYIIAYLLVIFYFSKQVQGQYAVDGGLKGQLSDETACENTYCNNKQEEIYSMKRSIDNSLTKAVEKKHHCSIR